MAAAGQAGPANQIPLSRDWGSAYSNRETKVGFLNPGRLCYRNATMAALLHVPMFLNWIEDYRCEPRCQGSKACLFCGLHYFARSYWRGNSDFARNRHMTHTWDNMLKKGWLINGVQVDDHTDQDACEFLGRFFDVFESEASDPKYPVLDFYDIEISQHRVCTNNNCASVTFWKHEHERVLRCPFKDQNNTSVEALIGDCLADAGYGTKCSACQSSLHVRSEVDNPPEVLFVQAIRMGYGKRNRLVKLFNEVTFDEDMTVNLGGPKGAGKTQYELCAAVFHWGGDIASGHYVVAAKSPAGKWTVIDDNKKPQQAVFSTFKTAIYRQNVSLLVYRKKLTGHVMINPKVQQKGDGNGKGDNGDGDGSPPQPMMLDATIELPGGLKWTFSQSITLPSDGGGLKLDKAKANAAKVRLSLTEPAGELHQGAANVQLQRGQGKRKTGPKGQVKGGSGKPKNTSPDRRSSRVRKPVKVRR